MDERTRDTTPDEIEAYLGEAERLLRRKLPDAWVEDAIDEARRHLEDRSQSLIAEGMPPEQARAVAVSAFGPSKEWAKSVAESAYEDAFAKRARVLALIGFVMALTGSMLFVVVRSSSSWRAELSLTYWRSLLGAAGLGVALVALGAFRGRRPQPRAFALAGAILVAIDFAYFGCIGVTASNGNYFIREDLARYVRYSSAALNHYDEDLKRLRLGLNVYANPSRPVPASLLDHGHYIAPSPVVPAEWMMLWSSPFKRFTPKQMAECRLLGRQLTLEDQLAVERAAPYRVVATREEAAISWRSYGDRWINLEELNRKGQAFMLAARKEAFERPAGFDPRAGAQATFGFGILAIMLLLLDRISASAGRWAFRWRKAPRLTTR